MSADVVSLPYRVNAVGSGEHRLGLHAEKRATALPVVYPELSGHMQGPALALTTGSLTVTPTCIYRLLYGRKILTCKSPLLVQLSVYNM